MPSPFLLFPWQRDFLPDLKDFLNILTSGQPGRALVIVPHNRPWRYLSKLYATDGHTGPLPKLMPLDALITAWRACTASAAVQTANQLDRIALLRQCVSDLTTTDADLAARFAGMDTALFLPWGFRLASLLEEMLTQNVRPTDMHHAEHEVAAPAAALLGALGRIATAYQEGLHQKGWTTPGLDRHVLAHDTAPVPARFLPTENRPVVIAGFSLVTGSEELILRRLWQAGAHVCLHTDPQLAQGTGHWACDGQAAWIRRWKARARAALDLSVAEAAHSPEISFFSGYDCHSQLKALRRALSEPVPSGSSANPPSSVVVLTNNSLLMPVLHHLPDREVNVSMGYPLARSPLNRLLEALLQMQTNSVEDGLYYWRDILQCLRHPYWGMLRVDTGGGEPVFLRRTLRRLEKAILAGTRFQDLDTVLEQVPDLPLPEQKLLRRTMDAFVRKPEAARTLDDMADCLNEICSVLYDHGADIWRRFPLDAEGIYRLALHITPQLRQNSLARIPFPRQTLYGIVRHILHAERIPFEADPLTGLQVLGMLETRMLRFDHVHIVDATDDNLPGNAAPDPLLPDPLRQMLGLPDSHSRERAAAHTLYRLCAGAQKVRFYWQEGIRRSSLFDEKKSRSRFVEQLIWEEEKKQGTLLEPGKGSFATAACTVHAFSPPTGNLARGPGLAHKVRTFLQGDLSATALDVYLQCPLRFARHYLCGLRQPGEVNEGDDPPAVGICIHKTLYSLYAPYKGKTVCRGNISPRDLHTAFRKAVQEQELQKKLPPASFLMLEEAAPLRLQNFLDKQPEGALILDLEAPLTASLLLAGRRYSFKGVMDRLDQRSGRVYILDYKTGHIKPYDHTLWTDLDFFQRVSDLWKQWAPDSMPDAEKYAELEALFDALRPRLPSLQLPCYLAMAAAAGIGPLEDAALVDLRSSGEEKLLFGGLVDKDLEKALNYCNLALALVLRHMEFAPSFLAKRDRHCTWCPYAALCAV